MKIGILTQPLNHNYGGILQNFALQTVLRQMGHEPITLNYAHLPKDEYNRYLRAYIYRSLRLSPSRKEVWVNRNIKRWRKNFIKFEKKYISQLYAGRTFVEKKRIVKQNFDAFIVGSDQTWRPIYNPGEVIYNMFLDFAQDISSIKRLSYAASFGVDSWEFDEQQTERCKSLLDGFDAVSVREISGIKLCSDNFQRTPSLVLDPTMLLNKENYKSIAAKSTCKDYFAVYFLEPTKEKLQYIKIIEETTGKHAVIIGNRDRDGIWQSIEAWLGLLLYSDFVITDSFHGTVFSILFEVPFFTIKHSGRGSTRIDTLISYFGIKNRVFKEDDLRIFDDNYDIDWVYIKSILSLKRKESMAFLHKALEI